MKRLAIFIMSVLVLLQGGDYMATRTKLLTDATYSPTLAASEAAIRTQIDGSIQEVLDLALADTTARKLSPTGDFTGTINGGDPTLTEPGLSGAFNTYKANNVINIKDLGAKGDGVTDDTAIITSAFANTSIKALYFPKGDYLVYGTGAEIFTITRQIKIYGDGMFVSRFLLNTSIPSTTNLIKIIGNIQGFLLEDMGFVCSTPGTVAKDMIYIDVSTVGNHFSGSKISRCYFDPTAGNSINVYNVSNPDGFYTSSIEGCIIYGGINLTKSGDSISIIRNKIGLTKTGIVLSTISGAMRTLISENNITSSDGAMVLTDSCQVSIKNNQLEATGTKITQDALITINGGNNIMIEENNIDTNGILSNCVNINNTIKSSIDKNSMQTTSGKSHIIVGSGAKDTYIGYKNTPRIDGTVVNNLVVTNNGIGTTNVDVNLTLLNSWVNSDSANKGVTRCHKTSDGTVLLMGEIKSGTVGRYTSLFILPEGFRPKTVTICKCVSESSAGVEVFGSVLIDVLGNCQFYSGSNFLFNLNSISFKADSYLT